MSPIPLSPEAPVPEADPDDRFMRAALALARRGLGNVWPNPAVGCVITRDGRVLGRGWTQPGGRPHAETEAIARARRHSGSPSAAPLAGATAYVSLEPCAHFGKTPPCADALVKAGVARVVVAAADPDPRVSGRGIARLRAAGIAVTTGLREAEAAALNAGFFLRVKEGRPLVTLKLASTLDGRIATASGESRWITGEAARARVHALRAGHDAVMVGSNTVLADDPLLTCRLPGLERRSPVRIVIDGRLRTPLTSAVVADAGAVATWIVTALDVGRTLSFQVPSFEARADAFRACGVTIIEVPQAGETVDLHAALRALGERGLTRLLVEGGGGLGAALLRARLVDRIAWFRAGRIIGGDGIPAVAGFGLESLAEAPLFRRVGIEEIGEDLLETLERRD